MNIVGVVGRLAYINIKNNQNQWNIRNKISLSQSIMRALRKRLVMQELFCITERRDLRRPGW